MIARSLMPKEAEAGREPQERACFLDVRCLAHLSLTSKLREWSLFLVLSGTLREIGLGTETNWPTPYF